MLSTMRDRRTSENEESVRGPLPRIEAETERTIREAIEAGEFRGLPGEGAPLPPDEGPERWAAARVMKNASALPEWAELRREVEAERERLLRRLRAHLAWLRARDAALEALPAERILDATRATADRDAAFRRELSEAVARLNATIARHNLVLGAPLLQLAPLTVERLFRLAGS